MRPLPGAVSSMADPGPSRSGSPNGPSATLEVDVLRKSALWDRTPVSDAMLADAARAAFAAACPPGAGASAVTIVLADDAEMRALNRTWRGKDAPTNVLSFPTVSGALAPLGEPCLIGEVVLACETVMEEARAGCIALTDHAVHLVVHGVLHLQGFEHDDEAHAERMENLERKILASFGIADPYAEAEEEEVAEMPR